MGACSNATRSLCLDLDQSSIFLSLNFRDFFPLTEQILQILKNLPSSCSSSNLTFVFQQIPATSDKHSLVPLFFLPLFRLLPAIETWLPMMSTKGAQPFAGSGRVPLQRQFDIS